MSLGRETTRDDIDFAVDSLKVTLENLRSMSPLYEDYTSGNYPGIIDGYKADGMPHVS